MRSAGWESSPWWGKFSWQVCDAPLSLKLFQVIRDAENEDDVGALTFGGGGFVPAPVPAPAPAPTGVVSTGGLAGRRTTMATVASQGLTPTAQIIAPTSIPTLTAKTAAAIVAAATPTQNMMSITKTIPTLPPATVVATPVTGSAPPVRVPVPAPPPASSPPGKCPPGQYWSGYACLPDGTSSALLPDGFSGGGGAGITTTPAPAPPPASSPPAYGLPAFGSDTSGQDAPPADAGGGAMVPHTFAPASPDTKKTALVVGGVGAALLALGIAWKKGFLA